MAYSKSQVDRAGESEVNFFRIHDTEGYLAAMDKVEDIDSAFQIVDWWRSEHARPLSRVGSNLRYYAAREGEPVVAQRLKRSSTIVGKLIRHPGMKLSRMEDIGGVRAILPNQIAAYKLATRLRKNWTITRFRDYVAEPKADGYRALHLINRYRGHMIEVQLRTPYQDRWANNVEKIPALKFGGGPPELHELFRLMGDGYAEMDEGRLPDNKTVERIMELGGLTDTFSERESNES